MCLVPACSRSQWKDVLNVRNVKYEHSDKQNGQRAQTNLAHEDEQRLEGTLK